MIGSSNDEINFPHKLLLTNTQVSKICKVFATDFQWFCLLSEMIQSGGIIGVTDFAALIKGLLSVPKFIDNE